MKVLYVAPFKNQSGYSNAALNYLSALDTVGVEVVPRSILEDKKGEIPLRFKELEAKSDKDCTVLLQHSLPHHFSYNGNYLNVGMFASETSLINADWVDSLNMMDRVIVFNQDSKKACLDSGVTTPIFVVPHCFDTSVYERSYEKLNFGPLYDNSFKFLYLGEINERKNLPALLKAFHLEFAPDESVELFIKTSSTGFASPEATHQFIEEMSSAVKTSLNKYPDPRLYKREIVICEFWEREQVCGLLSTCDALVLPSHGEAFSIPAFEALAFGKEVVAIDQGGVLEYSGYDIHEVKYESVPVESQNPYYKGEWNEPLIWSLRSQMRNATTVKQNTEFDFSRFSYEVVGEQLKNILLN